VSRGYLVSADSEAMQAYDHGGVSSVDASVSIGQNDPADADQSVQRYASHGRTNRCLKTSGEEGAIGVWVTKLGAKTLEPEPKGSLLRSNYGASTIENRDCRGFLGMRYFGLPDWKAYPLLFWQLFWKSTAYIPARIAHNSFSTLFSKERISANPPMELVRLKSKERTRHLIDENFQISSNQVR
jgi:hypothetical protein